MAQIFPRLSNHWSKVSIVLIGLLVGLVSVMSWVIIRSPYVTDVGVAKQQPVPFSHEHHVRDLGIDCRYCHTSVETGAFAGVPPVKTCMNCHSQIWTNAEMLEPIRESFRTGTPVKWERVNNVPDFVFFNHSIHIAKGVGCTTCHGQIDRMPIMWKQNTLYMEWCLNCHQHPEKFVRPRDQVFHTDWKTPANQAELGALLVDQYKIRSVTNCSACHH